MASKIAGDIVSEKDLSSKSNDVHSIASTDEDDKVLEQIGYVPSFKREFSNLATVRTFFHLSRDMV